MTVLTNFTLHFYLRDPKDNLQGGDIILYKSKRNAQFNNKTNVINQNDLEKKNYLSMEKII